MLTFSELVDAIQESCPGYTSGQLSFYTASAIKHIQNLGVFARDLKEVKLVLDDTGSFTAPSDMGKLNTVSYNGRFYKETKYNSALGRPENRFTYVRMGKKYNLQFTNSGSVVISYYSRLPSLPYMKMSERVMYTENNEIKTIQGFVGDYATTKSSYTNWVIEEYPHVVLSTVKAMLAVDQGDENARGLRLVAKNMFDQMLGLEG